MYRLIDTLSSIFDNYIKGFFNFFKMNFYLISKTKPVILKKTCFPFTVLMFLVATVCHNVIQS